MRKFLKFALTCSALLALSSAWANPPNSLVIINNTSVDSDAMVHGQFSPPEYVTAAHSTEVIQWNVVKNICHNTVPTPAFGGDVCAAEIYADINSDTPVDVGTILVNLDTGVIHAHNHPNTGFVIEPNAAALGVVSLNEQAAPVSFSSK